MPITGDFRSIDVQELKLDPRNPRLPESDAGEYGDQVSLVAYVAEEYDALKVARSISEHGYFPTERPICVIENEHYVVVEGNRRVAACKLLLSSQLRDEANLEHAEEWETLAASPHIPESLDVLVVKGRPDVAPLIAYRHISGIEPWEPWARARFLAAMVDEQLSNFEEAASQVGESTSQVRKIYRDFKLLKQASGQFGLDTSRAEKHFGIFNRAMQEAGIRAYVGAPTPGQTVERTDLIPQEMAPQVAEVLSWLYGADGKQKVIDESRDIGHLGRVLQSGEKEALRLLQEERDLPTAFAAAGGIKDRLLKNLRDAKTSAERAGEDLPAHRGDGDVEEELVRLEGAVSALRET